MKKTATTTRKRAQALKKKDPTGDVDVRFSPVVRAFANNRHVRYGKMFASNGLKVNGRIFAMFVKGNFVAKLPKQRVDELVRAGKGTHFDPGHGRLMKEWVAMAGDSGSWVDLAHEAEQFVKTGHR
jgi:hypothetical protein